MSDTPRTDSIRAQLNVFLTGTSGEPISAKDVDRQWSRQWEGLLADYATLERELAQMASDLADANHWRERHSNDSDARGKQSHEHWLKWRDAERRVSELEAVLVAHQGNAAIEKERGNG